MYSSPFRDEDLSTREIPDGIIGSDVKLYLNGWSHISIVDTFSYSYQIFFYPYSSSDVNVSGLVHYSYEIYVNNYSKDSHSEYFDPTLSLIKYGNTPDLSYLDNVTFQGFTEIQYYNNTLPQNETFNFELRFQHTIKYSDILLARYNTLWMGSLVFIPIYLIIIPPIWFYVTKPIVQRSKETIEKDNEYSDYLKEENIKFKEENL